METRVMIILMLILLCTAIFASEDPSDAAEHERKTQELNQLAERFKAETGFTGSINYGYERMRLGSFEGNFSDIQYSADEDTIAFRQACERIVEKILPLSPANRMQLSMSRISKSVRGYTTDYYQQVNGYRVEGAGFIVITYEEGRKRFSIGDNTVELPDVDVSAIITLEEAIRIANLVYFKSSNPRVQPRKVTLEFTNGKNQNNKNYYLCYNLYMGTVVCVDAVTGDVRYTWSREKVHTGSVLIKGAVYEKEYVNHDPSPLGNLPQSGVLVSSDSFVGSTDDNGVVIGIKFSKDNSFNSLGHQAMRNLEILNGEIDPYYTNDSGIAILTGYPSEWFQVSYQNDRHRVRSMTSPSCLSYSNFTQTSTGIKLRKMPTEETVTASSRLQASG